MAAYTQSLGTFHGYANGNPYGRYNCYLDWDGTTRSGSTVTLVNPVLRMTRTDPEKYTTNRIATRIYVAGSEITSSGGYTLNAFNSQAPNTMTYAFNNRNITTNSTSFTVRILIASTGANTGWANFQSTNLDTTVTISCPSAYPTYTTAPSITNIQETSMTINRGATDISSKFYYSIDNGSSWTELTQASTTKSSLTPGTKYTFKFKAVNATDASLTTPWAPDVERTTYLYPYVTGISTSAITIGSQQRVDLYNPLGRTVTVFMTHGSRSGTTIYEGSTSGTTISFAVPVASACAAIGATSTSGTAHYYCKYGSNGGTTSVTGTYNTTESLFKPTWNENIDNLFTFKDGNEEFVESITHDNQLLVQKLSKLFYGVCFADYPAKSSYSSTIARYEININNRGFVTIPSSSTTPTIDANYTIPESSRVISVALRAIDGRGYVSNVLTKSLNVLEYKKPTGTVKAYRVGGYGTAVELVISPVWGISNSNAGRATYQYQQNEGAMGTATSTTTFDAPIAFANMDNESSFTFKIILTDSLGLSSDPIYCSIGIGEPILFIDVEQAGVGVNCFPDGSGLYARGNSVFYDDITVEKNVIVNNNEVVKGSLEVGAHRRQTMTRNGEVRTGWFYTGGGSK